MRSESDAARASALVLCAGGGIGDSLLASVVARALRTRFSHVDALTLVGHRSTLERVPEYDAVLIDDGGEQTALAQSIGERGYAAAVVTWATARIARIVQLAAIPTRVGQARRLYSGRFTHRIVVRSERGDVTTHWTQVLLDYARAIGCDTSDTVPRFVPTQQDEIDARAVMARHRLMDGRFLIVHPSNAVASKRPWPVEGWRALCAALSKRFELPVVVTGGRDETSIVDQIVEGASDAIALAGETSVGAFGALASRARAHVGITTGVMHVAAAVGTPTVGIFPFQTDFPDRWAPVGRATRVVRASYPCHPGDTKERCPDYACIAHLDVPRIVATTAELLQ